MRRLYVILFSLSVTCSRLFSQTCDYICNGDFDNPFVTSGVALITTLTCWNTEGSDGITEVWGTNFNGVPSYNGNQHVELNGTQAATMYQDFNVSAGTALTIRFAHRGRAGIDTMQVSIGPVGGPYTSLGRWGDGTQAWGYYTVNYTPTTSSSYRIRFTPVYWAGNNIAIGNFLDAVSVKGPLSISITAATPSICLGNTVNLIASGASSFAWISGPSTASYTVSPSSTTIYTVTGTSSSGCAGIQTVAVNVNPLPIISAVASKTLVCKNAAPAIITASGGISYVWSGGAVTSTIASGSATSVYTVTGTDNNGCKGTATVQVKVILCEGIHEETGMSGLMISPNPNNGSFEISSTKDLQLLLYNELGQIVKIIGLNDSNSHRVFIENLTSGIFFIQCSIEKTNFTKKIVVTN